MSKKDLIRSKPPSHSSSHSSKHSQLQDGPVCKPQKTVDIHIENEPPGTPCKNIYTCTDEDVIMVTPPAREPIPVVDLTDMDSSLWKEKSPPVLAMDLSILVSSLPELTPLREVVSLDCEKAAQNPVEPTNLSSQSEEHKAKVSNLTEMVLTESLEPSLPSQSSAPAEIPPKSEVNPKASAVTLTKVSLIKTTAVPPAFVTTASPVTEILTSDSSVGITPRITTVSSTRPPVTIMSKTRSDATSQTTPQGQELMKTNVFLESPLSPDNSDNELRNPPTNNYCGQGIPNCESGNGGGNFHNLIAGGNVEGHNHFTPDKPVTGEGGKTRTAQVTGNYF